MKVLAELLRSTNILRGSNSSLDLHIVSSERLNDDLYFPRKEGERNAVTTPCMIIICDIKKNNETLCVYEEIRKKCTYNRYKRETVWNITRQLYNSIFVLEIYNIVAPEFLPSTNELRVLTLRELPLRHSATLTFTSFYSSNSNSSIFRTHSKTDRAFPLRQEIKVIIFVVSLHWLAIKLN